MALRNVNLFDPGVPGGLAADGPRIDWVRMRTLIRLRWITIAGQVIALLVAELVLGIDARIGPTSLLIAASVLVNLALGAFFPGSAKASARAWAGLMVLDIGQLMGLVALTGGLSNPFALLVLAPVTVAALALPLGPALLVMAVAIAATALQPLVHLPLYGHDGELIVVPVLLRVGFAAAIGVGIAFLFAYARSVSQEMHIMADALLAARLALAREQKLTDLAGVVAAAAHELGTPLATIKLASAEMVHDLADQPDLAADAALIRDQADRCRDILRSMGRAGKRDSYIASAPLTEVLREAAEPHLHRGKEVLFVAPGAPPLVRRSPEVIHALRNLIQNAVDFARSRVWLESDWKDGAVRVSVLDDGPGFPPGLLSRLGDPFLSGRDRNPPPRPGYDGMGMGLFIAKTLLAHTGAEVDFVNHRRSDRGGSGALVRVEWPARAGMTVVSGVATENQPIVG